MRYIEGVSDGCRFNFGYQTRPLSAQRTPFAQRFNYEFQLVTDDGICYVTKMKKNLKYTVISSVMYVNEKGLDIAKEEKIAFEKGDLRHKSCKVEILEENKTQALVHLSNNFELSIEDLREIYQRHWEIEILYRQFKQNFPLHFFYGDSVNAIQTQTWAILIAICFIQSSNIR
ncbi:MAG: transposase [Bacteroidales bacterium]|jgi:IS4 transposase|nr:transposase [Bacteroidales bacterium]